MVTIKDIKKAKKILEGVIEETPLTKSYILSENFNSEIYLKEENLQLTGSFKLRGAYNRIANLSQEKKNKGVVAASAGNHAQGLAFAANKFGCEATIFMPETTPLTKISGVKLYGANVVLHGENFDEAYEAAIEFQKKNHCEFIHPFADDHVIAGQGTICLEILKEIPHLKQIVVPIGGGGLIAGISIAAKSINPDIKIIGVVASGAKGMKESYKAHRAINSSFVRTIADGIAVRDVNPKLLDIVINYVDHIVEVNDNEIANAILFLLEKNKLVVEGAGAVSAAAIIHNKFEIEDSKICAIISGGNIDVTMVSQIIEKGLTKSYRKMKLVIKLMDKPGSLVNLSNIFKKCGANIIQIDFDRNSSQLDFGEAQITISLETKGESHQKLIKNRLKANAYKFKED